MGELRDAIDEKENDLENIEAHIKMWASATPKDVFITSDDGSLLSAISFEVNEILADYKDTLLILKDLRLYLEYVEENKIDLSNDKDAD
jgi:hypothetical protein